MLGTEEGIDKFLTLLPDDEVRAEVKNLFDKSSTSLARWETFVDYHSSQLQSVNFLKKSVKTNYQ